MRRWLVAARHPDHQGVVSFDLGPPRSYPTAERALRHAVVHALHYFRDDDFEISEPVEIGVRAGDVVVDAIVEQIQRFGKFHQSTDALKEARSL